MEKVVETFVYAPVGAALFVRDTMPTFMQMFIARGRNQVGGKVKDVGEQLGRARETGEHAITFSSPMAVVTDIVGRIEGLRGHFDTGASGPPDSRPSTGPTPSPAGADTPSVDTPTSSTKWERAEPARTDRSESAEPANVSAPLRTPRADASALAIHDYDELSASQVVERLGGLSTAELAAIRSYEEATRGRRTILGRIDALSG